jgi:hypothetical protein
VVDSTLISAETSVAALNRELRGYRILRQIGHGAMGVVFEAEQTSLSRRVAIKVLPQNLALRERTVKRFLREAEAMGRLDHANVVDVYEVGSVRQVHYFSMRFVEGPPLDRVLKAGPLAIADVVAIGIDVASALAHAHARGVLHRDVKPANLLRDGSKVVLTDFGLARPLDAEDAGTMTESGDLVGTPLYMAPEQISGDSEKTDGRADVWGLGVTLYELLVQKAPFSGANAQAILHAILHRDPPRLSKVRKDVPRDLEAVVHRCLEKDPARRYSGAAALLDDLNALREHRPVSATPPRFFDPALRWLRGHPLQTGVLAASLLSIAVLGLFARSAYTIIEGLRTKEGEAKVQVEAEQARTVAAKHVNVASTARNEMSELRMLWLEGRTLGDDARCREAELRLFDLWRASLLDAHPEIRAEVIELSAEWSRARGDPDERVLAELEPTFQEEPSEVRSLYRAAILAGLGRLDEAIALQVERARLLPADPRPRLDSARLERRRAHEMRGRAGDAGFRAGLQRAFVWLASALELALRNGDEELAIAILIERARCELDLDELELARRDLGRVLDRDATRVDAQSLLLTADRIASAGPELELAASGGAAAGAGAPPSASGRDVESAVRGVQRIAEGIQRLFRRPSAAKPGGAAPPPAAPGDE